MAHIWAAITTVVAVAIILFFDWVPTPLNRNIAYSSTRARLPGSMIHIVLGAVVVVANLLHWRWVVLAGAIWYTFVLGTAILNWWVPWLTGITRGEISTETYLTRLSQFWWRVGGGCDTPGGLGVRDLGVR